MIHQFYYFNDRSVPAYVYVGHTMDEVPDELKPSEGKLYELELPEGQVPFIKVWETNLVFISGIQAT